MLPHIMQCIDLTPGSLQYCTLIFFNILLNMIPDTAPRPINSYKRVLFREMPLENSLCCRYVIIVTIQKSQLLHQRNRLFAIQKKITINITFRYRSTAYLEPLHIIIFRLFTCVINYILEVSSKNK